MKRRSLVQVNRHTIAMHTKWFGVHTILPQKENAPVATWGGGTPNVVTGASLRFSLGTRTALESAQKGAEQAEAVSSPEDERNKNG